MMTDNSSKDFFGNVFGVVKKIPKGKVTTYGAIAKFLGAGASARTVGWALNKTVGTDLPAHRVVNRNGELTGKLHFSTPNMMKELLLAEGINFNNDKVDLEKHLWLPEID